jgi:hypothetical protein
VFRHSPIAFTYTCWPERRAIDVYVHATSQSVRQRKLVKFLTTIFHLSFSFVLIMTQRPASGGSALMGYGGRCTAGIASEESKKSSTTPVATSVFFKTTRQCLLGVVRRQRLSSQELIPFLHLAARHIASRGDASISHLLLRKPQNEVPERARRESNGWSIRCFIRLDYGRRMRGEYFSVRKMQISILTEFL